MDGFMQGRLRLPSRESLLIATLVVVGLFAGAGLVYMTGGTAYAWPYVMLVPVLIAAAWFHVVGGVLAGLLGGLLLGPYMPLEVAAGEMQATANWVTRLVAYSGLGGFAGALFLRLARSSDDQRRASRTDMETGLPNQAALQEDVAADRGGADSHLYRHRTTLIVVRATDLVEALEAVGADATAEILPRLARRFRDCDACVRGVYRFSNSELAVLVEGVDRDAVAMLARRLQAEGETQVRVHGIPVRLELVAGAAFADERWIDGQALIRRARIALFAAIDQHHSFAAYSPDLESGASETVRLMARLRDGLDEGEFSLFYQPKVRLATGQPHGCEGLIRWITPESGMVSPGRFMPKVESTSLIRPVTRFVAESACQFAGDFGVARPVSINFSVRNLFDSELLAQLEQLLANSGIRAEEFEVEITEGALIRNPGEAVRLVGKLRDMGVRVSIDDFGTGYSSFEYLRRLPVTGLKIDRAFVRDIDADARARDLLGCMIDAGHALDLEVTAEGIETPEQCAILRELECDFGQGFWFARPMAAAEYTQWIEDPPADLCAARAG